MSKFSAIVFMFLFSSGWINAQSGKILINEFLAINNSSIVDFEGENSDWIELYNPGTEAVNLAGWYLTDSRSNSTKWTFPDVTIEAGGYLIVFASDKVPGEGISELHANFRLSGSGEYLALMEPDGSTISSYPGPDGYPNQLADNSYGIYNGLYTYFNQPTPGAQNVAGNFVFPPIFSMERGFYDEPFYLGISAPESSYLIYYTTDGSIPVPGNRIRYANPIQITKTTVLSAVCINPDNSEQSYLVTNTYLFPEDILNQPNNPEGYPDEWGPFIYAEGNAPADYEMDPEICTEGNKERLLAALKSIPTISIVTNPGYLFSHYADNETGGIYIYTGDTGYEPNNSLGRDWERPVSIEYFDAYGSDNFQVNCGLRLHGGNSRKPGNSPKHSFRASFRSEYGPSKLNFNLFDENSADNEFNALVFRAGYNYSWVKNLPSQAEGSDYIKDPFAKKTQLDMDRVASHTKFAHLYLNGLYWGVYNIAEKINNDFMESYLKGNEDDFDVVSDHAGVVDGTRNKWNELMSIVNSGMESVEKYMRIQGKNSDGTTNPSYENLLDVRNLIDYIIMNIFIGNKDWDHNNWYAARNRVTNDPGFRFFSWDAETSMDELTINMVNDIEGEPTTIYKKLQDNEEFRIFLADRLQKHFFNGGDLTVEETKERYTELAAEISLAMLAESARWGDYRRDLSPASNDYDLYTRDEHWMQNVNYMLNTYLPQRSNIVFQQFNNAGLFRDIGAPVFSHYGGDIPEPLSLQISSAEGEIYFTTDDTDPRDIGGSVNAGSAFLYSDALTINKDTTIRARVKSGNDWSALVKVEFDYKGQATSVEELFTENIADRVQFSAYPNPFNVSTNIVYDLPESGNVTVRILSMDGRVVNELFSGQRPSGKNRIVWTPDYNTEGIYFYQIIHDNEVYSGKLIYQK